jgi:hypothetical protein
LSRKRAKPDCALARQVEDRTRLLLTGLLNAGLSSRTGVEIDCTFARLLNSRLSSGAGIQIDRAFARLLNARLGARTGIKINFARLVLAADSKHG